MSYTKYFHLSHLTEQKLDEIASYIAKMVLCLLVKKTKNCKTLEETV